LPDGFADGGAIMRSHTAIIAETYYRMPLTGPAMTR
jgi:hypothetical protein